MSYLSSHQDETFLVKSTAPITKQPRSNMTSPVSVVLPLSSSGITACLYWDFHTEWYFKAVITKMVGDCAGQTTYCQIDHSTSRT